MRSSWGQNLPGSEQRAETQSHPWAQSVAEAVGCEELACVSSERQTGG